MSVATVTESDATVASSLGDSGADRRVELPQPVLKTNLGVLFQADCLDVLPRLANDSIDAVFADPPFNLRKKYGSTVVDDRPDYLTWCQTWLQECVRLLRPGGALFVYNLPKWNIPIGFYLGQHGMEFRHWIAVEHASCLPISGRLYPAHYSLLYYTKGRPRTFRKIRTPIDTCRHCGKELKDYGGHRKAMNPHGVNLKDIWTDIPPVRHVKFKPSNGQSNSLSTKLLERVVEISTEPGDTVLDPFGGSGTAYAVCEQRGRHWIGIEVEDVSPILERLAGRVENHVNLDVVEQCQ